MAAKCLLTLLVVSTVIAFANCQWPNTDYINEHTKTIPESRNSGDPGDILLLTPFIDAGGSLEEARNLSRVHLNGTEVTSFSGFLTVDPKYNSTIFFWFFPCQNDSRSAPLVVWFEGGPGFSTVFAIFTGNGPWRIDSEFELQPADVTWISAFNILYIDNPVGAGFSFTDDFKGYARNVDDVSGNLYETLKQFFVIFDDYVENDLYIMGVSYAGKYVPGLAHRIHTENSNGSAAVQKMNLKGIAIENGLVDPESQLDYGTYLYNMGLIDETQLTTFLRNQNETVTAIRENDHEKAFCLLISMLIGCSRNELSFYFKYSGLETHYNYLISRRPSDLDYWTVFLNLVQVRRAIHIGDRNITDEGRVVRFMETDITRSVKPLLEDLLVDGSYKILLYNGQVDVAVPYVFTSNMVRTLNWTHAQEYASAPRVIWRVHPNDTEVAGYAKSTRNFTQVLVRNAGHMVAYDQPRAAFDMITKFVFDRRFA